MARRAFPEPDFETRRLGQETAEHALRSQQIIAYESGVAATVDALGGSYAMESLTNAVEAEAESGTGATPGWMPDARSPRTLTPRPP